MKIVVLGGAGDMGSESVRDLVKNSYVEKVIIADINLNKAKEFTKKLGKKAVAEFVDAEKHDNLVQVIKKGDVVLSCIGPFYKFEAKVAKASIDAGSNYISICDDFDAVEQVLELDSIAKKKGITVLTGCGWTPGISNILAAKGASEMDKVEKINIAWSGDVDDSEGLAIIKHTYHIFTGKIKTFINGKMIEIPAGSGKEVVEFLKPIGKIPVYHLGHPEPVTIPKFIPKVKTVTLKGGLTPVWLNNLTKILVKLGLTKTPEKKDRLANITKKIVSVSPVSGLGISGLRVDVKGIKDRRKVHYVYNVVDRMRRLTGIPAAIGAVMLGSGEISKCGVVSPESCVDFDKFIDELEKRNIKIVEQEI